MLKNVKIFKMGPYLGMLIDFQCCLGLLLYDFTYASAFEALMTEWPYKLSCGADILHISLISRIMKTPNLKFWIMLLEEPRVTSYTW